ncbi:MAG: adenylate kinase [Bacteroidota bacterium]
MLNLILFGPPGAGKGTQSEKIIDHYNLTHISTGDLFRKHLGEGTELGQMAKKYMDVGNLVPDEVVIKMVEEKIKETEDTNGFIFDGYPRTVAQAEAIDKFLKDRGTPVSGMICLEVDEEELWKRIQGRAKVSGRADDQDKDKFDNRIKVYQGETLPVAEYFQSHGKCSSVEGTGTIEEIFSRISSIIDSY